MLYPIIYAPSSTRLNMQRLATTVRLSRPFRQFTNISVPSRTMSSLPTSIRPSRDEIKNKRLTPQNLEVAIRSLYHDGLVVVEDAIPHEALDRLNAKMVEDAYALQSKKENSPYNYNPGNIQQDPPPVRDYFDTDIFLSRCQPSNNNKCSLTSTLIRSRSNRHANHLDCIGSLAQVDLLLRKLSNATDRRASSHVSARACRCRL